MNFVVAFSVAARGRLIFKRSRGRVAEVAYHGAHASVHKMASGFGAKGTEGRCTPVWRNFSRVRHLSRALDAHAQP